MSFDAILSRIAKGESVPSAELLPYLCLERQEHRANVNKLLAEAFWNSGRQDYLQHAGAFIRRAWLLSRFSPELLPVYTQIHAALDDVPRIREAYKRVGMMMASQGNVAEAISYFNMWQYAYSFKNLDKYEYDFDILEAIDRLALPHRFSPQPRAHPNKDGKVRIAYLVKGIAEVGSVLVKINLFFARYHDRSRVEPLFFVPETERTVFESEAGREHVRLFESYGCKLYMAPDVRTTETRLLAVARMIHNAGPDALITSAALAHFDHYFITSLRPAPVVMGLVQGPPEQFAPLTLDWGIAWSIHPLIDCPVSCSQVIMEMKLPERGEIIPYERHELGIPDGAQIAATAGRHVKFQDPEFWKAIIELLIDHSGLHYFAIGVEEAQIPFLSAMLPQEIRNRIRFIGWRGEEYLRAVCLADVFIDTFPSGGGAVLTDAVAIGIPVVSFRNNYMRVYDQTDWSPAEELIDMPEIIVARGDFAAMKRVVSRLLDDQEFRRDVARRSQEHVAQTRGNPERGVHKCEELYIRILGQELPGATSPDPRGAEVEELSPRPARPQTVPYWVAWPVGQLKRALRFGERVLDRVA